MTICWSFCQTDFEKLPQLRYLDLRNNQLQELPTTGLSTHKHLSVLLLSRNCLTEIPLELGFVKTLQALHWVGNPIETPERNVLEQTTWSMKQGLRRLAKAREQCRVNEKQHRIAN